MNVSDILRSKGTQVVTVTPDDDIQHLLTVLAEHRIGAVIVSGDGSAVDGIVSERDVVRGLAERGAAMLSEPIATILTAAVRTVTPEASLEEVERTMTEHRFRHMPVTVGGALCGIVSIGDIVKHRIDDLQSEHAALTNYITGSR
jgi:CBS domain-containing protein